MELVEMLVTLCFCTVVIVIASPNNDNETATIKLQLKQMEETVSDLQKHMLAQEQKQTAVLSSVLSRLTETTDELATLQHNYTVLEDELTSWKENSIDEITRMQPNYTNELAKLQHNFTDKLANLQQKYENELAKLQKNYTDGIAHLHHNYKILENRLSFSKDFNTSGEGEGARKCIAGREVAFEANMGTKVGENHIIQFPAYSHLIFPTVQYNQGGCWNSSNGVFTATVNGTYQFWVDLTFTGVNGFNVVMKKNQEDFGMALGSLPIINETTMISRISLTYLMKGDHVYFVTNKNVSYVPSVSSCGGVLLHSDEQ